jgi:predicted fused transcriptional regulator/phosphomethylpyrimidine kinase
VAAAVAIRCDDWVPEVAQRAGTALAAHGDEREVAAVVGVILRLVHRRRGQDAAAEYCRAWLRGIRRGCWY